MIPWAGIEEYREERRGEGDKKEGREGIGYPVRGRRIDVWSVTLFASSTKTPPFREPVNELQSTVPYPCHVLSTRSFPPLHLASFLIRQSSERGFAS